MNISCFAYKPVFIKEFPPEAIEFANKNKFPILEFGGDEFFEDIIFAVQKEICKGSDMAEIEHQLQEILQRSMATKEIFRFMKRLNPDFKRYIRAVYLTGQNFTEEKVIKLVNRFSSEERLRKKASICKYGDGCFILLTQETEENSRFDALISDVFSVLGIDGADMHSGFSFILRTDRDFGKAICEAYWSCMVAELEDIERKYYEDMGIYRFIVPQINSPGIREYMEDYLAPLLEREDELLETARTYILLRGSLENTAEKLFCHKNTVRYRLAKIHEMIDPMSNDKEFFENLAIAIRIYMLVEKKEH